MAKKSFKARLSEGPILLDGAMGTLLHDQGIPIDACFDELNLSQPELVKGLHRQYIDAGAEVVETNTFGGNHYRLEEHSAEDRVAEINQAGVRLLREAISESGRAGVYLAGSVGPLGVRLEPFGRVSRGQAYRAFHAQTGALIEAGVDLLIMETFSDLHEISEAVSAAHDHHPGIPIIAQMTFTRDDRTLLGDSPGQVASALARLGVDVIGVNCSNGPAQILRVIKEMQAVRPDQRFSAAPNAGWPEYVHGRVMYAAGPEYFADFADSMRGRGVAVIGGCCGTTPTHIAAMRERLDRPMTAPIQVKGGLRQQEPDEAEGGQKAAPSALALKIAGGEFVVAVEMSPPKGVAGEKEIRAGLLMKEAGADVIDVLDSPMARMRMSPWALCYLLEQRVGIESVLHFPTRGRNLLRVQGDLLAAHALGVRNLFVVMGDPTHIGDYPDAADNYDIVPSGLIKLIKENLNQGIDSAGNNIGEPTNFLVSAALNVNAPDLDKQIGVLRKKIEAGVDYVITQPIYDGGLIERFLERYAVLHGPLEVPVLVGLLPLNSLKNAVFLHNEVPGITVPDLVMARMDRAAGDSAEEGARIARELADHLRPLLGGVYLLPQFRRYDLIADIVEHLREPVAG